MADPFGAVDPFGGDTDPFSAHDAPGPDADADAMFRSLLNAPLSQRAQITSLFVDAVRALDEPALLPKPDADKWFDVSRCSAPLYTTEVVRCC
jgi:hypothetical protein